MSVPGDNNGHMNREQIKNKISGRIDEIGDTPFEHLNKFVIQEIERPDSSEVTPEGGDRGLDITGHVGGSIYQCSFGVEIKHHSKPISADIVRGFSGALNRNGCGFGALITSSRFTKPAKEAAKEANGPPIRLVNGDELIDLMIEYEIGVGEQEGYYIKEDFWSRFQKFDDELISSKEVPQADRIEILDHVLQGIRDGYKYAPEIAENLTQETEEDWTRRQADYYTLAASALGFLKEKEGEYDRYDMRYWELTSKGEEYINILNEDAKRARELLHNRILNLDIFDIVVEEIKSREANKVDHDDIKDLIRENTEITGNTVGRRASTIRSWLKDFDEVRLDNEGMTTYNYFDKRLSHNWEDHV
jgi:hypothetical protein